MTDSTEDVAHRFDDVRHRQSESLVFRVDMASRTRKRSSFDDACLRRAGHLELEVARGSKGHARAVLALSAASIFRRLHDLSAARCVATEFLGNSPDMENSYRERLLEVVVLADERAQADKVDRFLETIK